MDAPPLTLTVSRLAPSTLLLDPLDTPPLPQPIPSEPLPLNLPIPSFSPTHSYPAPHPTACLGSALSLSLGLANNRPDPVLGVKMMCELQAPGGRYRLGEIIHGQEPPVTPTSPSSTPPNASTAGAEPELAPADSVALDVETEIKELGLHVVIVSVAWETADGRRTFQRFFKFNVEPPLAIKTRIHSSSSANTLLDPVKREWVYLEVLAQNASTQGMIFDKVDLEPVHGLESRMVSSLPDAASSTETLTAGTSHGANGDGTTEAALMPGDTRQYLFVLSPSTPTDAGETVAKPSRFPPAHQPGTILPLGRLDLNWRSGIYHDKGRLQTSTLNRRIPVASIAPTRTLSAASPRPGGRAPSPSPTPRSGIRSLADEDDGWEFDLTIERIERSAVPVEQEFTIDIRVGARSLRSAAEGEGSAPAPPRLGVQYLTRSAPTTRPLSPPTLHAPLVSVSGPSRSNTPMTRTGSNTSAISRPFSPAHPVSRPMTPVSSQLRQATTSTITSPSATSLALLPPPPVSTGSSFPPAPILRTSGVPKFGKSPLELKGLVQHLGVSLVVLDKAELELREGKVDTTYSDPISPSRHRESSQLVTLKFIALEEGMAELGGMRVLLFEGEGDEGYRGSVGREWESLGEVWVTP